jgi:hypothetical protein
MDCRVKPGNDGLIAFASTEAVRPCLPLMDCLSACLLLGLDEFGNFNRPLVFWLRAAAVVRNDTDTGVGFDRVAA